MFHQIKKINSLTKRNNKSKKINLQKELFQLNRLIQKFRKLLLLISKINSLNQSSKKKRILEIQVNLDGKKNNFYNYHQMEIILKSKFLQSISYIHLTMNIFKIKLLLKIYLKQKRWIIIQYIKFHKNTSIHV